MKTQTSKSQIYCEVAAIRYARVLYEVSVPKEAVQKTREIFEEVPQLHEIFANPTIEFQKKMNVVDRVFPKEIRNFLKVACRYQRMNLIEDIFTAYDRYCDEQNQVLNAVLTCIQPPTEEQKKGMEAFLCKKYGAKRAKIEVRQDKALLGGFILRVGSDELRVVGVLGGKGVELILRAGAHPGVGRHPQLSIPDWGAGRDGDHPGRAVQCQGTTGFLLLVHEIASCQQHTIPAPPQNIHIQTQQKSGGKYDVRPGLYTEPGRGPPGLLPTNKADILEVMKEVHHPDIVNVVVHFISPF